MVVCPDGNTTVVAFIKKENSILMVGKKKAFLQSSGLGLSNRPSIYKKSAHHNTNKVPMSKTNRACVCESEIN